MAKRRGRNGARGGGRGESASTAPRSPIAISLPSVAAPAPLSTSYGVSVARPESGAARFVSPDTFHALVWTAGVVFALVALRGVVTTLLVALTLALLLAPVVARLEARGLGRSAASALALVLLGLSLALLSLMFLPRLLREVTELLVRVPDALRRLVVVVEERTGFDVPQSLSGLIETFTSRFAGEWQAQVGRVLQSSSAFVGEHAGQVLSALAQVVGTMGQAVFVPLLAFFIVVEIDALAGLVYRLSPPLVRRLVDAHGAGVRGALGSLVKGQLMVALAMAVIYVVGLMIAGVPLALAIGLISGLAYVVPFASGAVCVVFSVLFVLLEPELSPLFPIAGAVITAIVVQVVEGSVLTPRIVGEQAGLSPLAVILAVLVAGELFGFLGVLFALPVATALAVVIRERAALAPLGMSPAAAHGARVED